MEKISYKTMEGMDRLLIYELSENLKREQLEALSDKGERAKSILIYDYIAGNNAGAADLKAPLLEKIIHAKYEKVSPNERRYFRFKTPKKELILQQYRKNLSEYLSNKFPKLETKKELKQLYCLDELCLQLNKNRVEKLDFSENLSSVINSSIESYLSQQTAEEMKLQIEKFWNLANKVDYSDISLKQVKYLKSRASAISQYADKKSQDFEVKERITESKRIIYELNKRMNDGIENSIKKLKGYFVNLNKKEIMSPEEFSNLTSNEVKLSELETILVFLGDSRAGDASEGLKRHSELIQTYDYFYKYKDELNWIIKEQIESNKKIRGVALRNTFSPSEFFRRNRINRYIARTKENLSNINVFSGNRYLKKILDDKKEELSRDFKSLEFDKNWSEQLLIQKKNLLKESQRGLFWEGKVNGVTHLLETINQFENELNKTSLC